MKGKLYLIPIIIAEGTQLELVTVQQKNALSMIHSFLVEDIRTARRYLSSLSVYPSIEALQFHKLDKNTSPAEVTEMLRLADDGTNLGVMSESGCPGVADPGAVAVRLAHELGVQVIPLVGPSSILLALMASGLNGQQFTFNGYLPIESKEAARAIRDLEKESRSKNQTQIAIETPYRNTALLQNLVKNLQDNTLLTVAVDVTGSSESIRTMTVKQWKKQANPLPKIPTVFLFLAQ